MSFVLSKLLWPLAAPGNFLLVLLVAGAGLLFTRWRRLGRALVVAVTVGLAALAVLPVGQWLIAPLENRFSRPEPMPAEVSGVIVLGGALGTELVATRGEVSVGGLAERVLASVELMRRYPQARVVYSGGDPTLFGLGGNPVEAEAARSVYAALGAPVDRIVVEPASRNTYENAVLSKRAMQPSAGEVWLLVTSAWHMPRSVGVFRGVGWEVVPYPVDYATDGTLWRRKGFDLTGELAAVSLGLREWIGLAAYWIAGRTDSLFPAPNESSSES